MVELMIGEFIESMHAPHHNGRGGGSSGFVI